ncbi:MAG TPA: hypothetical protein VF212_02245 [Longimicrobiales bacterium]
MASPVIRAARSAAAAALLAGALACASREPPSADQPAPAPPDLSGRPVMLLPVQPGRLGVPAGLDDELAYWMSARAPSVRWVMPDAIDAAIARSPTLGIRPRALAVSVFQRAEVHNIGDPLFGDLRRLGALVEARYAILPVAAGYVSRPEGGRVEIAAAIIDTLGGRVLWYGIVAGEPGDAGSPAVVASAAQTLARTLFP